MSTTIESIADSTYPVSRPLYIYVNTAKATEKLGNGRFSRKVLSGEFAVSVEMLPARGTAPKVLSDKIAFIEELCRTRPVILFLEDVHWADVSTVDLLAYIGTKLKSMRPLRSGPGPCPPLKSWRCWRPGLTFFKKLLTGVVSPSMPGITW